MAEPARPPGGRWGGRAPSDGERRAVMARLTAAVGSLLPADDLDEHLDAVRAATTVDELMALIATLPPPLPPRRSPARPRRRRSVVALVVLVMALGASLTVSLTYRPDSHPSGLAPGSALSSPGAGATGAPIDGESVLISVTRAAQTSLIVETNQQDIRYPTCPSFRAVSARGDSLHFSALRVGDFAMVQTGRAGACISRISILGSPGPPECNAMDYGGGKVVRWYGFDEAAHSVLYQVPGPNEPITAIRWCQQPTIVAVNGSATTLADIAIGASVQMAVSTNLWLTGLTVR